MRCAAPRTHAAPRSRVSFALPAPRPARCAAPPSLAASTRACLPLLPPQGCTSNKGGDACTRAQPFTSGRLRTKRSLYGNWLYGRFEIRAQLPKGNFLWPAIWMLPTGAGRVGAGQVGAA